MYLIALVILGRVWDGIGQMAYGRSFATRFPSFLVDALRGGHVFVKARRGLKEAVNGCWAQVSSSEIQKEKTVGKRES